jgi:hypothetical protein
LPVFIWRLPITLIAHGTARRTATNTEIRKRTAKRAPARVTACELRRKSPGLTLTDGAGGPLPGILVGPPEFFHKRT